ncbi:MAG TPA: FAD-binding protein, partial [Coriobacteriia bacterium]|nr:FAD-binding protein [Coriobacteriia bacterium]
MRQEYDVIIVGAGPAGIFAAVELVRSGVNGIVIIEKGKPLALRRCPVHGQGCVRCARCDIVSGWGGAGAFSDGKLTLTSEVGGWLADYVGEAALVELIAYSDGIWLEFGADTHVHGPDPDAAARLGRAAALAGMALTPMRVRHLGTDRSPRILGAMHDHLVTAGVEVMTGVGASAIDVDAGRVTGVTLDDGRVLRAPSVIVAPGREGAEWLASQASLLGIRLTNNQVDIGVRVEAPAPVMEPLTDALYEAKLTYYSRRFGDRVRTFCMNPYGQVTTESYGDI